MRPPLTIFEQLEIDVVTLSLPDTLVRPRGRSAKAHDTDRKVQDFAAGTNAWLGGR